MILADHEYGPANRSKLIAAWIGLAFFAVVVPAVIAEHYGAFRIPRSDDWSYYRTLFDWHRSGHWDFNYWVSMTLVGQVFITKPFIAAFGANIVVARYVTLALGLLGLVAVARLARRSGFSQLTGIGIAVLIAAGPLWGSLAPTYMTDVPAFALQMMALACGARGLTCERTARVRWFALSVAVAVMAISIRQYAAVTLIALLCAYALAHHGSPPTKDAARQRLAMVSITAVAILALALLFRWWSTIPHPRSLTPDTPNSLSLQLAYESLGGFLRIAGLMLLPLVVLAHPIKTVRSVLRHHGPTARFLSFITWLVLVSSYAMRPRVPFVGNYFDRRGVLSDDIVAGTRPPIMPRALFEVLVVVASFSVYVLVIAAVPMIDEVRSRIKSRSRMLEISDPVRLLLTLSVFGFAAAYELAITTTLPIFDRYALPLLGPAAILFLYERRRFIRHHATPANESQQRISRFERFASAGMCCTAVVVVGGLGFVYTAESASFDGTRWKVADAAVAAGYSSSDINGGYEWVGYRIERSPKANPKMPIPQRQALFVEYQAGLCVTIVINPPAIPREKIIAHAWAVSFLRKPTSIYAVINKKQRCAIAPKTTPLRK